MRFFLNSLEESISLGLIGKLFYSVGAATQKLLDAKVLFVVKGITSLVSSLEDLRFLSIGGRLVSKSLRYNGVMPYLHL